MYECDPLGQSSAVRRDALGYFQHEAAAVDPVDGIIDLTEDEPDGRLYCFVIAGYIAGQVPSLTQGTLQVATVQNRHRAAKWSNVPNPRPRWWQRRTRHQVSSSTPFDGGEGCWYQDRKVYFTTKGDNRVWCLETATQVLTILYDAASAPTPILTGVDNVTVSSSGKVLVAEDGGDMQIVVIDQNGTSLRSCKWSGRTAPRSPASRSAPMVCDFTSALNAEARTEAAARASPTRSPVRSRSSSSELPPSPQPSFGSRDDGRWRRCQASGLAGLALGPLVREPVSPKEPPEGLRMDPGLPGRRHPVPAVATDETQKITPLESTLRLLELEPVGLRPAVHGEARPQRIGKIAGAGALEVGEDHRPIDEVSELSHVAPEVERVEDPHRLEGGIADGALGEALEGSLQEVADEEGDVAPSLAERGDPDGEHR